MGRVLLAWKLPAFELSLKGAFTKSGCSSQLGLFLLCKEQYVCIQFTIPARDVDPYTETEESKRAGLL